MAKCIEACCFELLAWHLKMLDQIAADSSLDLQCSQQTSQSAWEWKNSEDAVKAYTALLGFLALGQIPALRTVKFADLPYFIGLASMTIYIGAHRGLCTKVRQQITIKEVWQCSSFIHSRHCLLYTEVASTSHILKMSFRAAGKLWPYLLTEL